MKAVFVELPAFERHCQDYLDDCSLYRLQDALMAHPEAGDLIEGTGGLRNCDLETRAGRRVSAVVCA